MSQFLKKIMGSGSDDQKSQNKVDAQQKNDVTQAKPAPNNTVPQPQAPQSQAFSAPKPPQPSAFSAPSRPAPFATDGINCTTIGSDVAVTGTLVFAEKAVINGKFSGQIKSKGSLYIGGEGKVKSDLNVGSCVVEGELVGNINASGKVELRAKSSLSGDIKADKLRIEEGVIFRGHCSVGADLAEAKTSSASSVAAAQTAPAPEVKDEEKKEEDKKD